MREPTLATFLSGSTASVLVVRDHIEAGAELQ
jgi:hypothetical protein